MVRDNRHIDFARCMQRTVATGRTTRAIPMSMWIVDRPRRIRVAATSGTKIFAMRFACGPDGLDLASASTMLAGPKYTLAQR